MNVLKEWMCLKKNMRTANAMPPILLCWLTMSEANVTGMAAEAELSQQHSITVVAV